MIRVVEFDGVHPSVGYTDFSAVYVSTSLSKEERRTVLKHERAHIWLQHQARRERLVEALGPLDAEAWNEAVDLEIARHIYDQGDESAINAPRSRLLGGISAAHCAQYPDTEFAEDYYQEILRRGPPKGAWSHDGEACDRAAGGAARGTPATQEVPMAPSDLVAQALKKCALEQLADGVAAARQQAVRGIEEFRPPKPSLASLLDAHLGRTARARVGSYRRPARVSSGDLLKRGVTTKPATPRVTVYVDRSGSFSSEKTAAATRALKEALRKYRGRVGCDVIYFADALMMVDPGRGGGGTNYQAVVDQIVADAAEVALVITDDDRADGVRATGKLPPVVVMPVGCTTTNLAAVLSAPEARNGTP